MPEKVFVHVEPCSLNDKIRQHRSEVTLSREYPVGEIDHGLVEKSGEKKARENFLFMRPVKGPSHICDPVLDPEVPSSAPELTERGGGQRMVVNRKNLILSPGVD